MKKIIVIIMCLVLSNAFFPSVALAYDSGVALANAPLAKAPVYDDGTFQYKVLGDGTVSIVGYSGSGGNIVIPSTYDAGAGDVAVTEIEALAFYFETTLTSVVIPSSVKTIGSGAFSYCSNLTDVTLSEGLLQIDNSAFSRCGITAITIPSSLELIGDEAFDQCSDLSSVTLTNGLDLIGPLMFYDCDALTSITIPSSVTTIYSRAFEDCDNLKDVTFTNGLTVIGQEMFFGCDALKSVTIPSSVTSVGNASFHSCIGLETVTLKNKLIGSQMFYGCIALESITIPFGITSIGFEAFRNCGGLDTVKIPSSVEEIGDGAFAYCDNLDSVTVLGENTSFGEEVFYESMIQYDGAMYGFEDSTAHTYAFEYEIYFIPICRFSFYFDGGTDSSWGFTVIAGGTVSKPADPTWESHIFEGWYPTAACDTTPVTFPLEVTQDTTLYAKWTALQLDASESDGTISIGDRITLTPSASGGTWSFDDTIFSREGNTFTALKAGAATLTYTVDGASIDYNVTILGSGQPETGQNFTPWYLLLLLAVVGATIIVEWPRRLGAER